MHDDRTAELFGAMAEDALRIEPLSEGAVILRRFAAAQAEALLEAVRNVADAAPLRHMTTPGGFRMTAAMTNCGPLGWVTDTSGYRYVTDDPDSGRPWPAMPGVIRNLAREAAGAAGFEGFDPDACLVNRYRPGAKLSLHRDRDERDYAHPIVSVSLGLPATFLFGGASRRERPYRIPLHNGDILVWGGPARLFYHGVAPLPDGRDPLTGDCRINLTLRRAGPL